MASGIVRAEMLLIKFPKRIWGFELHRVRGDSAQSRTQKQELRAKAFWDYIELRY